MVGAPLPKMSGACKTSGQTVRWPVLSIPLPNSPGVAVSVDYFSPLPTRARGNSYILPFTDRFSRRADMFAVTLAEFTAEGIANILVNPFIPPWGYPSILLSDNGPQFCARLATAVYSPGVAVSVDYFGPLPTTARENSYILLFTDRFSRRADMFAVTLAEYTAEGTAIILVKPFIPLWGYPSTLLSDNGPQFCARDT